MEKVTDNKKNNFDEIIASREGNLFVFNFGAVGCGKSAMLAGLFQQCKNEGYDITTNIQDKYSYGMFADYTRDMYRYNELPNSAPLLDARDYLQISDVTLRGNNIKDVAKLTFFDFPGEELEQLNPKFKDIIKDYRKKIVAKTVTKEEKQRIK